MERIKRNERIGVMTKILTEVPNQIMTLSYFSELFGAAKSTISEDVDIARDIFARFGLGELETVTGAAGGVRYLPTPEPQNAKEFILRLCHKLSEPERILPGGYLYMGDVISNPTVVEKMGNILASWFYKMQPDFVLTVETKGIPVALMTARALGKPLVIARHDNRITEGSVVTINYLSGSSRRIETMCLTKRAVKDGQRALIIDDFMKGGGTAKGMMDMMKEFAVTVVGVGVVMATQSPERKLVEDYKTLMVLKDVDEYRMKVELGPSSYVEALSNR